MRASEERVKRPRSHGGADPLSSASASRPAPHPPTRPPGESPAALPDTSRASHLKMSATWPGGARARALRGSTSPLSAPPTRAEEHVECAFTPPSAGRPRTRPLSFRAPHAHAAHRPHALARRRNGERRPGEGRRGRRHAGARGDPVARASRRRDLRPPSTNGAPLPPHGALSPPRPALPRGQRETQPPGPATACCAEMGLSLSLTLALSIHTHRTNPAPLS